MTPLKTKPNETKRAARTHMKQLAFLFDICRHVFKCFSVLQAIKRNAVNTDALSTGT